MLQSYLLSMRLEIPLFPFLGLLFNLGVCWDRDLDLEQGLTKILEHYTVTEQKYK